MTLPSTLRNMAYWDYALRTGSEVNDRSYEALARQAAQNRVDLATAEERRRFDEQMAHAYWQPQFQAGAQRVIQGDRLASDAALQDQVVGQRYDLADFEAKNQYGREMRGYGAQTERDYRLGDIQAEEQGRVFDFNQQMQDDRLQQATEQADLEHQRRLETMGVGHGQSLETQAVGLLAQQEAQDRAAQIAEENQRRQQEFQAAQVMYQHEGQAYLESQREGATFDRLKFQSHYQAKKDFGEQLAKWSEKRQGTPQQQQELMGAIDAINKIENDNGLSQAQKWNAEEQIMRRARVTMAHIVPEREPTIQERFQQSSFVDQDGSQYGVPGAVYGLNEKGRPIVLIDPTKQKPPTGKTPEQLDWEAAQKYQMHQETLASHEKIAAANRESTAQGKTDLTPQQWETDSRLWKKTRNDRAKQIEQEITDQGNTIQITAKVPGFAPYLTSRKMNTDEFKAEIERRLEEELPKDQYAPTYHDWKARQARIRALPPSALQTPAVAPQPQGQPGPVQSRAIEAARMGDVDAQRVLDERRIQWRF